MTEAYRQKLLNWFTSVTIIWAVSILSVTVFWFFTIPANERAFEPRDFPPSYFFHLGTALIVLLLFSLTAVAWHVSDFVQLGTPKRPVLRRLSSYPAYLLSLVSALVVGGIIGSGQFNYFGCGSLPPNIQFGFWECLEGPPDWLAGLYYVVMFVLILQCLAKAVISLNSRLKTAL